MIYIRFFFVITLFYYFLSLSKDFCVPGTRHGDFTLLGLTMLTYLVFEIVKRLYPTLNTLKIKVYFFILLYLYVMVICHTKWVPLLPGFGSTKDALVLMSFMNLFLFMLKNEVELICGFLDYVSGDEYVIPQALKCAPAHLKPLVICDFFHVFEFNLKKHNCLILDLERLASRTTFLELDKFFNTNSEQVFLDYDFYYLRTTISENIPRYAFGKESEDIIAKYNESFNQSISLVLVPNTNEKLFLINYSLQKRQVKKC